jgi:hypothetical protein
MCPVRKKITKTDLFLQLEHSNKYGVTPYKFNVATAYLQLANEMPTKNYYAPFSFSNHLDSVAFRLSWQSDRSIQLSLFPLNLLLFNFDLFSSFDNFNLYLLITDLLADLGSL